MKIRVIESALTDGSTVCDVTIVDTEGVIILSAIDQPHAEALAEGLRDLVNEHCWADATIED